MGERTDRELLELAAKSTGLYEDGYRAQFRDGEGWLCIRPADETCIFQCVWSPLFDDGDALRLAVTLGLTISPYHDGVFVSRDAGEAVIAERWNGDRSATTRLAIVRAAADIGARSDEQQGRRGADRADP